MQSGRRGKLDLDHHFAFLTIFLKRYNLFLDDIFFNSAHREHHFQKKRMSETDLLFRFCKIELGNTLFIFGRKMVVCCLVLLLFILFQILTFLIEALVKLRKMLSRKKLFDVRLGNCSTPKVLRFYRFTKMQLTLLLD